MTGGKRIAVLIGGLALLSATAIDTLAVIGRHAGAPVHGSIELMQAAVLVSGAVAILISTVDMAHARVRLLVARLSPRQRIWADRFSDFLTLIFYLCLLAGTGWIAWDLRAAHEQSELLGIPWMALRIAAGLCLLAACGALAWRIVRPNAGTSE
jgi:TRAP-type C4-dicarboxylate transport system permease small subunit